MKFMPSQKSQWQFPKIHALSHYKEDILRAGVTCNYDAEMWEALHKYVMKKPWQRTNKKNVDGQIMKQANEQDLLASLSFDVEEFMEQEQQSNIDKADITGMNVLPNTKKFINLETLKTKDPYKEKWRKFDSAMKTYLINLHGSTTQSSLPSTVSDKIPLPYFHLLLLSCFRCIASSHVLLVVVITPGDLKRLMWHMPQTSTTTKQNLALLQ